MRDIWKAFRDGNRTTRIGWLCILTGLVVVVLFKPLDLNNTLPGLLLVFIGGVALEAGNAQRRKK